MNKFYILFLFMTSLISYICTAQPEIHPDHLEKNKSIPKLYLEEVVNNQQLELLQTL